MTPLFFFFTLCVSHAGGEDCSFDWEIRAIDDPLRNGEFDIGNKTIVAEDMKGLMHEIEHVMCSLRYPQGMGLYNCYQDTHTRDIVAQIRNEY